MYINRSFNSVTNAAQLIYLYN